MADLLGIAAAVAIRAQNPGRSTDLDSGTTSFGGASATSVARSGSLALPGMSPEPRVALTGAGAEACSWWDKIISLPTSKALGIVASQQAFTIEIWSTFRRAPLQIGKSDGSGVDMEGVGGAQLSGVSLPAALWPLNSKVFTVTIPEFGPASIASVASFETYYGAFGGPGFGVIEVPITGMRIVLFPFDPNWARGVKEQVQYKTKIITARTGAEQRYRLRLRPRRSLEFDVLALNREAQPFDAIVWDRQGQLLGVPWWPEAVPYSGTLSAGASTIPVSTANRIFSLAPMVMVWSGVNACEVQSVESVASNLITCAPLAGSYTNPLIVPVFPGRLEAKQDTLRLTSKISSSLVKFSCEVSVDDARPSPSAMTTAYGYDVLQVEPSWKDPKSTASRILSKFDNGSGPIVVRDRGGVSFQALEFAWHLSTRAEIQAFRDFVDLRGGSLVPFWVPTRREDLTLAQLAPSSATGLLVKEAGYSSRMFPDVARRYLAIRNPSGGWIFRKVTSASSNGTTETLGIDVTPGVALPAETPISFLVLCRMESDSADIRWSNISLAESEMRFIEVPKEVSA